MPVDTKILIALITGATGLITAIVVAFLNSRSQQRANRAQAEAQSKLAETNRELAKLNSDLQTERDSRISKAEVEKVVSKFRDPLLHAAYDFQSRIFNILERAFLDTFYSNGNNREKEYAIENTVFLIAQFLGWTELIRQQVRFLDLEKDEQTRALRALQDQIYTLFQTDSLGNKLRLFAGDQRAVGELMIDHATDTPQCIGYAAFLNRRNADIDYWLDPLRDDLKKMPNNPNDYVERLVRLQHALIELLEFLDPKYIYFPRESRDKVRSFTP